MNKNYNKKKHITIITLSVLAVCLAVILFWYVGTMETMQEPETEVLENVPEIDVDSSIELEKEEPKPEIKEAETEESETKAETEESPVEESSSEEVPIVSETPPTRSDGNPQTPEEALPPTDPPVDTESSAAVENPDENGNCQPEHIPPQESQPQGGDINPEGAVYVPGFGYIENSGPNEQENSYTDGDWDKQIGTMQ